MKNSESERNGRAKRFEYLNMGDKIEHICVIVLIVILAATLAIALMV